MSSYRLRILHLSDLHERGFKEGAHWRRRGVLGRAWEDNLDALRADGPVDLVCFTGDTAERGLVDEFRQATDFFLATLDRLGVPEQRFFPVPGNHDMQRERNTAAWRRLRSELTPDSVAAYSAWLAGGETPKGTQRAVLDAVLGRQANYRHWLEYGLGRSDLLPDPLHHPRLGYRRGLELPGLPFVVQIIGLDSAWLSGDDHDPGRLWLTANQVDGLCEADDGESLPGFRLALLHHPLDWLADGHDSGARLLNRTDLLLRGYPGVAEAELGPVTPHQISTGCLYQRENPPQPPCTCQVIEVTLDEAGRPRQYDLRFRRWSPAAGWFDDNSRHPGAREGRLHWWVGGRAGGGADDDPSAAVFVGRERELAVLRRALLPTGDARPTVCCVQGIPGVGKSFLVDQFFALHQSHFPGGYPRLVLDLFESPNARDLALGLLDRLELPVDGADPLAVLRERLRSPATLVNIDNVDTREQVGPVLELVESLGCAVVVSGRLPKLGLRAGWEQLRLTAFDADTAMEQLSAEVGMAQDGQLESLVRTLGCLPLTVHLAAGHLRTGRSPLAFLEFLRAHGLNTETGPEAGAGSPELTRAVLVTVLELSLDLLRTRLGPEAERLMAGFFALSQGPAGGFGAELGAAAAGLSAAEFEELIDRAHELSLLDRVWDERGGRAIWRLHRLLAEMLRLRCSEQPVLERMSVWFLGCLGASDADPTARQRAWKSLDEERGSLVEWLGRLPEDYQLRAVTVGADYIGRRGPFQAWVGFLKRVLAQDLGLEDRCRVLHALNRAAFQGGLLDTALEAAEELSQREIARVRGQVAEVLAAKGEHDQALAIRRGEELPIYQRLNDARCQAEVQSRIADSLVAQGDLDGALAVLQNAVLPVLARPADARERAGVQERIAGILTLKGEQGQALGLYEAQVPVYEQLRLNSELASILGRIADLLFTQGRWDEALTVRRDRQLPLCEQLGDIRELTVCRTKLGILYLVKSDRKRAGEILCTALRDASRLGLREAAQIDEVLRRAEITCN